MHEDSSLKDIFSKLMIEKVPSYANKFFYSLGFLSMICLLVLIVSGLVMVSFGPNWWLVYSTGIYFRSIHLWATQAFVLFMILHLIIVFLTGAYKKPRRLTWIAGALMFIFAMIEAEFGYVLRGDFSSQYRSLQGSDLFNGAGIGGWLNELNYRQIYGIHIVLIPAIIISLLLFHYLMVKVRGIAKPSKESNVDYKVVKANHKSLFIRGGVLISLILFLAAIYPSPYIQPTTIRDIATQDPNLMKQTLLKEFNHTSNTATYLDNIDPYKFNTRTIFIKIPYLKLITSTNKKVNIYNRFTSEPLSIQKNQLHIAYLYFKNDIKKPSKNPVITIINNLSKMASSGLYQDSLITINRSGDQTTYIDRFLSDSGVMDIKAQKLGITTEQYGMLKEESPSYPLGAWWLSPIGLLDHTILAHDINADRDGDIILGALMILFVAVPYIPFINTIPDKLKLYKFIWHTKE